MSRPVYIAASIMVAISALIAITEHGPGAFLFVGLLVCSYAAPMMLVLWLTLTVTLKNKIPVGIMFNFVAMGTFSNALLLFIVFTLLHFFGVESKPWEYLPAAVVWSMSYVGCTLGYWWTLGRVPNEKAAILSGKRDYSLFREKDPESQAKKLPDGLNMRNSLYISLFVSALQQPYYYLLYTIASQYLTPANPAVS